MNVLSCWPKASNISGISTPYFPALHLQKSSQRVRACTAHDGAICSKNRKIVSYHGDSPNTKNSARLRSPSPIITPGTKHKGWAKERLARSCDPLSKEHRLKKATNEWQATCMPRKTLARKLDQLGYSRDEISAVTGHSNIKSLDSYLDTMNERKSTELSLAVASAKSKKQHKFFYSARRPRG